VGRIARAALTLAELVKFEHTIFALPFALIGASLAAASLRMPHALPSWSTLGWILLAMVGARTTAMAFNRIVDARYDAANPRTMNRAIPKGTVKIWQAWALTLAAAALLVFAAANLNRLCLMLSPVAVAAVMGYSLTKRFTQWTHFALGAADGIAPVGAWLGVTGSFAVTPILLWAAVTLWIGGFDIFYALQDTEVDRRLGIFSLPARLGPRRALCIARVMHAGTLLCLGAVGITASLGGWYYGGLILCAVILGYEHRLVKPYDLRHVNTAFQTLNGWVSIALWLAVTIDRW
jgi:4-hydroxybenzoate polyprenyltransferase